MPQDFLESLFSLEGRSAVVTGGSAGLGKMIARALIAAGAQVRIVARNGERAERIAAELDEGRGRCTAVTADVTAADGVAHIRDVVAATGRPLDILVNNAGITRQATFETFPAEHWDEVMTLNVKSPFMLVQALHPLMRRTGRDGPPAHILNIGSGAGITIDCPASFSYYASKAALHHLSRILAKRFLPDRIHVNVIAPGYFHTELIDEIAPDEESLAKLVAKVPVGRFGQYEDIGALALSVLASGFITGAIIPLDGGYLLEH
jgi:NAD(P)-dependent dehydrogenase (short-subunit alcohol dehydrogenase family)